MDDLSQIERNFGCVAEYNRSQMEDEEHEEELRARRAQRYRANREKVNSTDMKDLIWYGGWGACSNCLYADKETQRDETDDMEIVICKAPKSYNCKTRNEERKSLQ